MKKIPFNELFSEVKEQSMTETEKKSTWDGVLRRASDFPDGVSPYAKKKSTWDGVPRRESDFSSVRIPVLPRLSNRGALPTLKESLNFSRKRKYALGILAGSLVLSGGISVFAQSALPGDALYPVKIHFNEKIQTSLAFTPLEKVNIESTLATKRLEEVEQLAAQGKLTPTLETNLGLAFTEHVQQFQKNLTALEAGNQVDASVQASAYFTSRLAAHTIVLNDLSEKMQNASSSNQTNQKGDVSIVADRSTSTFALKLEKPISPLMQSAALADGVFDKLVATTTQLQSTTTSKYVRMFGRENVDAVNYLRTLRKQVGLPTTATTETSLHEEDYASTADFKHGGESTPYSSKKKDIPHTQSTSSAVVSASTTGRVFVSTEDTTTVDGTDGTNSSSSATTSLSSSSSLPFPTITVPHLIP